MPTLQDLRNEVGFSYLNGDCFARRSQVHRIFLEEIHHLLTLRTHSSLNYSKFDHEVEISQEKYDQLIAEFKMMDQMGFNSRWVH